MIPDESTRLLQVEVLDDITDEVNTVSVKVVLVLCKAAWADPRTATEMDGTHHTDFRKSETSRDVKKYF